MCCGPVELNSFSDKANTFNMKIITDDLRNDRVYNGSEDKFGITCGGTNYLVKQQKKDWRNVYSEAIASNFIEACGINCHKTFLAQYNDKDVVVCEDFTSKCGPLFTLKSINSSSIDTDDDRHEYFYEDVIYELERINNVDIRSVKHGFMYMYLMDLILGNSDRHKGNWGMCKKNGVYTFSPIFDNGACLFPRNHNFTVTEDWMRERVFVFPNSKLMFNSEKRRSSYYEIWQTTVIPAWLREFASTLDVVEIMSKVLESFNIVGDEASYYRTLVYYRYSGIVKNHFEWKGMI